MPLSHEEVVRIIFADRARLTGAAWVVVRDAAAAEDIFQTAAIKAVADGAAFESNGHLLSWVRVTVRHGAIDWLRKRRPEWVAPDDALLDLIDSHWAPPAMAGARVDALRDCVEQLPDPSRRLLELRYSEGRSGEEVAAQLGARLDTVYQRLSRLHRALRTCVDRKLAGAGTTLASEGELT